MTDAAVSSNSLGRYLDRSGSLIVLRPAAGVDEVELFLVMTDDGGITAFNGHVDLGTGIRTALTQIVAEELDVPMARVTMVLGDTALTPDQGPTIASETIQVTAVPLRQAAAQARLHLLDLAAAHLARSAAGLRTDNGCVVAAQGDPVNVSFDALLIGRKDRLVLSGATPVKAVADYRIVGQSVQRVDIAAKATGQAVYVHDVRVPGMLHGRVVRPPYVGLDCGPFVGTSLKSVDESSVAGVDGIIATVVIGDFIGVVTAREEQAESAASQLRVSWKATPAGGNLDDLRAALSAQPSRARTLREQGDVLGRIAGARDRLQRTYVWPYQLHGSIGPSCAVADYRKGALRVWSGTQNPLPLRADLALLLGMPQAQIEILRFEASGCYGRNCADDVAADAALLSRAVGRPVRVQLTREQEHQWEPKGAAQVMNVDGGLAFDGAVAAYDFSTCYPSNGAPTLALLLTGAIAPEAAVFEMGDRTAIPPYRFDHLRVVVHDMAPLIRASWLRGVSALPNTFAHECYVDELAAQARVDPIDFRLNLLDEPRAKDLIAAVAQRAGWQPHTMPRLEVIGPQRRRGQGIAYAQYVHGEFPGTAAAWSAWVAEVDVDLDSGVIQVTRVVVGQDSGLVINPAGVQHQIHGNVLQSISRTIKEELTFDGRLTTAREWGAYPVLRFPELPTIQVVLMAQPTAPPLGAGESASVPSAAAIANAIFDATGVRLREPPFTPERVRAALRVASSADFDAPRPPESGQPRSTDEGAAPIEALRTLAAAPRATPGRPSRVQRFGWGVLGAIGVAASMLLWRGSIAPVAAPTSDLYSAATIALGRQLAAAGNCAGCHTRAGGAENAGGRPLETPFGIVYTANITPDVDTGIGGWSFAAFERAMRQGIHRDGRRLYPAFPYTAFSLTADRDLQALYAYVMSQAPIRAGVPQTRLSFPFNIRPLLAVWNALFLRQGDFEPDAARSAQWNRGAYLVEGLGHCSACHSPRNAWGAERTGGSHLAGGQADGWDAPALTQWSFAPVPWSEAELYSYLRTGASRFHGAAAGPMQQVVAGLAPLPDADVSAMAHYLASFNFQLPLDAEQTMAAHLEARAASHGDSNHEAGATLFEGACGACHDPLAGSLALIRPSLAVNTNLHSDSPNNTLRAILEGVNVVGLGAAGAMPGFRASLDDRQLADLVAYLRGRFAADKPAWVDVPSIASRLTHPRGVGDK